MRRRPDEDRLESFPPTSESVLPTSPNVDRVQRPRSLLVLDVRRYNRHRGQWLIADRLLLGGRWTPLVRVRLSRPRIADGGSEI